MSVVVISLPCVWSDFSQESVDRLCAAKRVIFCRDMDVSYDVGYDVSRSGVEGDVEAEGGYPNMSCRSGEEVEDVVTRFLSSPRQALGVTVHPSQYYAICKACKCV